MGLRVHKILGYGLTGITTKAGKITDPRIKRRGLVGLFNDDYDAAEDKYSCDRWRDFLEARANRVSGVNSRAARELREYVSRDKRMWSRYVRLSDCPSWSPVDCVTVEPEWDDQKTLVLTPPEMVYGNGRDWRRYDTTIDWVEEFVDHNAEFRIKHLRWQPLPPYGWWMDDRTGRLVKPRQRNPLDILDLVGACAIACLEPVDLRHYNKMARDLGFKNASDAKLHMVPEIPLSLRLFCEFADIFSRRRLVLTLRPMLIVYWA